jgi:hypothetical protein
MTIAAADLDKAIVAAWDAGGLNAVHTQYWSSDDAAAYPVLHDMEATPGQPFPYTVFEHSPGDITDRMSGHSLTEKHAINDVPVSFRIHADQLPAGNQTKTAKELAAEVAEEIMKVYGGHPTVSPTGVIELDNGSHLITQYQTDYGVRTEDEVFMWVVSYIFRLDVPIAV